MAKSRPLGKIASMFNKACQNNVFGNTEDLENKANIPVHVRQTVNQGVSHAKIEAHLDVMDPDLSTEQLTIDLLEAGDSVILSFGGAYFTPQNFQKIADQLRENPDIQIVQPVSQIRLLKIDDEIMETVARAWRNSITEPLRDLGYEP